MGDGTAHGRRHLVIGRFLGDGIAESVAGARIGGAFEQERPGEQRGEIERQKRQRAVDRGQRRRTIAERAAHRGELGPQRGAIGLRRDGFIEQARGQGGVPGRGGAVGRQFLWAVAVAHASLMPRFAAKENGGPPSEARRIN